MLVRCRCSGSCLQAGQTLHYYRTLPQCCSDNPFRNADAGHSPPRRRFGIRLLEVPRACRDQMGDWFNDVKRQDEVGSLTKWSPSQAWRTLQPAITALQARNLQSRSCLSILAGQSRSHPVRSSNAGRSSKKYGPGVMEKGNRASEYSRTSTDETGIDVNRRGNNEHRI